MYTHTAEGQIFAVEQETGRLLWRRYFPGVHVSFTSPLFHRGRLFVPQAGLHKSRLRCLDAASRAIHVVTIGQQYLFAHSQYRNGFAIDKETGKILSDNLTKGYRCTRFTLSQPYLLGPNLDLFDFSDPQDVKLVSCGPPVDLLVCLGAFVSNGRIFHTTNGTGLQCSAVYGEEAKTLSPPWEHDSR